MSASSFLRRLFGRARTASTADWQPRFALCESLLGERGEISGAALAREALARLAGAGRARARASSSTCWRRTSRRRRTRSARAADAYRADPTPDNLIRLQEVGRRPLRQELFRRLNMAPGGDRGAGRDAPARAARSSKAHPRWKRDRRRPAAPVALVVQPRLPARSSASTGTRRRSCSRS